MSTIYKSGKLRGDKVVGESGRVWCCVWYPLPNMEDAGPCFDFGAEDIDDLIALLQTLKAAGADKLGVE